jgi:hypothetical protein
MECLYEISMKFDSDEHFNQPKQGLLTWDVHGISINPTRLLTNNSWLPTVLQAWVISLVTLGVSNDLFPQLKLFIDPTNY